MKTAIYCRLSEEDRDKQNAAEDSQSIQNQKSMLLQHALNHGWDIYNIYSDDDYTGADRSRPAFNQLLADAEARRFDIVLCKTQSRFTRELELVEKYIHGLFPRWGIRFVSIVDHADTEIKGNKKARQINGLINEWFLEDMSENIKSVLTNKRKSGLHIGSFALYGYQKNPNQKGHLIIDEEAAEVVREVFTLFSQGHGKTAIARLLNDRGIPNPTEYKRQKKLRYKQPKSKHTTLWKYFAISNMLTNEIYIGNMVQGKYGSVSYKSKENKPIPKAQWIRVARTHESIIDMALWNQAQALLAQKAKPFTIGTIGLFAKKAKCMNCGCTMRSSKNHGRHYLKCATKHTAKDACIGAFVSVETLEQAVLFELKQLNASYLDYDALEANIAYKDQSAQVLTRKQDERASRKRKIEEKTTLLKALYIDKVKGLITEEDFLSFSKDFSKEKKRLEKTQTRLDEEIETLISQKHAAHSRRQMIDAYVNPAKLSRVHVDHMIDSIFVGKRNPEAKALPVEIHWNF